MFRCSGVDIVMFDDLGPSRVGGMGRLDSNLHHDGGRVGDRYRRGRLRPPIADENSRGQEKRRPRYNKRTEDMENRK